MVEHPLVYNVRSHAIDLFYEPSKDVFIKSLVDSVTDMLKITPDEDFHRCYQKSERLHQCGAAHGKYFKGDNVDI